MMRERQESGFALPMTVFLIAIVTLMLTAAFSKVSADRRVADASGANIAATSIAKAALQNYLGTRTVRPADGDSVRVNVTGGYADVIAKVIRKPVDPLANWTYVVRSVGRVIDPTQGSDPQAVRTVGQFAQWQTGRMDILGAYTASNNVNIAGTTGYFYLYGYDNCGATSNATGIRLPNSAGGNDVPSGSGSWYDTYGSPVRTESGNHLDVATATNIDWNGLVNGGFTPDYTSIQLGSYAYSSQMIIGNATLSSNEGTGLLIVTGDLTFSGEWGLWYGVILVGGRVYFNSTSWSWVQGALVSGLNRQLGTTVSSTSIGTTTTYLLYDSCEVSNALSPLTGFAPITNGWVDNWATY